MLVKSGAAQVFLVSPAFRYRMPIALDFSIQGCSGGGISFRSGLVLPLSLAGTVMGAPGQQEGSDTFESRCNALVLKSPSGVPFAGDIAPHDYWFS